MPGHGFVIASSPPPTSIALGVVVEQLGEDSRECDRRAARRRLRDPRQRRDHDRARLRLPPRVDDRASIAADVLAIPHPRFGVDRLAHRSQKSQLREIVLLGMLRAPFHEGANRRGRRVEDRDAVLLAELPEAILRGPVRRALVHQARRAVRERTVHDVRVSRHPAHVGGAPVDVVLLQIEDRFRRERALREIAAGGVHDALRLSRGARRVQREENVLGVHRGRRARSQTPSP